MNLFAELKPQRVPFPGRIDFARRYVTPAGRNIEEFAPVTVSEKKCTKCGKVKPAICFRRDKQKADGLYSSCIECYYKKHQEIRRLPSPLPIRHCAVCGKSFKPRREQLRRGKGRFCSQQCKGVAQSGANSPLFIRTGKTKHRDGREFVRVGSAFERNYRAIVEQNIGRKIAKGEAVHHIDCDRTNNTPANLFLCTSSEHQKAHVSLYRLVKPLLASGAITFNPITKRYEVASPSRLPAKEVA